MLDMTVFVVLLTNRIGMADLSMTHLTDDWPETVEKAVTLLLAAIDDETKERLAEAKQEQLWRFHWGLGIKIRDKFGLWSGNEKLVSNMGCDSAEEASRKIIRATWNVLHDEGETIISSYEEREVEDLAYSNMIQFEALIHLLVDKGVLTQDELAKAVSDLNLGH
jgi:DNA topoisomerase IB